MEQCGTRTACPRSSSHEGRVERADRAARQIVFDRVVDDWYTVSGGEQAIAARLAERSPSAPTVPY
jgi:hypothetical protein